MEIGEILSGLNRRVEMVAQANLLGATAAYCALPAVPSDLRVMYMALAMQGCNELLAARWGQIVADHWPEQPSTGSLLPDA